MKKDLNERLLIFDLDVEILVFDILDLKELEYLLMIEYDFDDKMSGETLKWYGDDAVYYYRINDDGNIVLMDLIAR